MAEPIKDSQEPATDEHKKEGHISEATYGFGRAAQGGLLAGVIAAVIGFTTMYVGRQRSEKIRNVAKIIENIPEQTKQGLRNLLPPSVQPDKNSHAGAAFAVAGVLFVLGERLAQLPAYFSGAKKAKEANQAYDNLKKENEALKQQLASTAIPVTTTDADKKFSDNIEKRSPAFTETLQQQASKPQVQGITP